MAGSGMMLKVWEDRAQWSAANTIDIQVMLSDLVPRGPYADRITERDLLDQNPAEQADYIVIDPPYCGLVNGQYSNSPSDLANMEPDSWVEAMEAISKRFSQSQPEDGRCTVIVPNSRTITTGKRILFPEVVRRIFQQAGYRLYEVTYASRRTQQRQDRKMGVLNNRARREKVPMDDIAEVLTFINGADSP